MDQLTPVRDFIQQLLKQRGDRKPFSDDSSLFRSGRLSSVDSVELVVLLEEKFGIDFAETGFDQNLIDSVEAVAALLQSAKAAK
jgi:acyl carrier protein